MNEATACQHEGRYDDPNTCGRCGMTIGGTRTVSPSPDEEPYRKPPPIVELTPEVIDNLTRLLNEAQKFAGLNGLPWRREAASGKPLLYGGNEGRGACIAYGTIGSWNEIDLAVAAVNALPALLAAQAEIARLTTVLQGVREPSPVSTMDYATLDTPIGNTTKGGPKQSLTLRQWLEADNRTPQFRARLMALCIIERQQAALAALKGNQP